jgi:hypothetical protein
VRLALRNPDHGEPDARALLGMPKAALPHPGTNEIALAHADARPWPADGNLRGPAGQVMYDAVRLQLSNGVH